MNYCHVTWLLLAFYNSISFFLLVYRTNLQVNLLLCRTMKVLLSVNMCNNIKDNMAPYFTCLHNHLMVLSSWLYPASYHLFSTCLWEMIMQVIKSGYEFLYPNLSRMLSRWAVCRFSLYWCNNLALVTDNLTSGSCTPLSSLGARQLIAYLVRLLFKLHICLDNLVSLPYLWFLLD